MEIENMSNDERLTLWENSPKRRGMCDYCQHNKVIMEGKDEDLAYIYYICKSCLETLQPDD